ncbi:MAG: CDP-alcohol phosphatidyltransferase family protein [Kiloniellaceae bacterium]
MLDARLRKLIDPPLDNIGRRFASLGVTANGVTWTGFLVGCGAWAMLALGSYGWALALILLNRVADGLDGAVARHGKVSDLGGYLDIVLDFLFYAGVVFFFAVGRPEEALPAAFLIFSFVGTGASFLAFAALAAKRGISTAARGSKSIYYLGGLTEGSETIALFVAMCLLPDYFAWFAWIFGGLCWLTTAVRIFLAVETFSA